MTRTFIETLEFTRNWGGLRKLRFAFENMGKSGSTRVCYVDFPSKETVYLITIYPKNEKDNLTRAECKNISKLIQVLAHSI